MSNYEKLCELSEKLDVYARLEGTELGEGVDVLRGLSYYHYIFSAEFLASVEIQMQSLLTKFETECEIVESETEVKRFEKSKELVWNY